MLDEGQIADTPQEVGGYVQATSDSESVRSEGTSEGLGGAEITCQRCIDIEDDMGRMHERTSALPGRTLQDPVTSTFMMQQSLDAGALTGGVDGPELCECQLLLEELEEAEQLHMTTLQQWLDRSAALTTQIAHHRIEKAQKYYDAIAIRNRAQIKLDVLASEFQVHSHSHSD